MRLVVEMPNTTEAYVLRNCGQRSNNVLTNAVSSLITVLEQEVFEPLVLPDEKMQRIKAALAQAQVAATRTEANIDTLFQIVDVVVKDLYGERAIRGY